MVSTSDHFVRFQASISSTRNLPTTWRRTTTLSGAVISTWCFSRTRWCTWSRYGFVIVIFHCCGVTGRRCFWRFQAAPSSRRYFDYRRTALTSFMVRMIVWMIEVRQALRSVLSAGRTGSALESLQMSFPSSGMGTFLTKIKGPLGKNTSWTKLPRSGRAKAPSPSPCAVPAY